MQNLQHIIASLNHLAVFEASARLCSFTKAAEELGVSQPAVSQSIRQLETAIGIKLFKRNHRIISLTTAGASLKTDVAQGLGQIAHAIELLQRQGRGKHVTLSVSSAFAHYWMVPRLQNFRKLNPQVDLRMQQTEMELDLDQEGISLAVWRGDGNWRGYHSALLATESISILASPSWVQNNPAVNSLKDLNNCSLIVLEEPHRYRPSWADFFDAFGQVYKEDGGGLRLNDYTLVLQAGLAGEGPIFGWDHITRHLVEAGLLVRLGDWCWESGAGFYLVWSQEADLTTEAEATRDWIISCGEA